jgi:hypothetical protein
MRKTVLTIAVAMGLILPGSTILAQTAQQTEKQEMTEKQKMLQKGSPAAGEQEQVQERIRTRVENQTRASGDGAEQYRHRAKSGPEAEASVLGDQLKTRDRIRDKEKDADQLETHDRLRDRDRIHEPAGSALRNGVGRR